MILWITWLGLALAAEPASWLDETIEAHGLTEAQAAELRAIVAGSNRLGTGLPGPTVHAMTPEACAEERSEVPDNPPAFAEICGHPHMAPLYDPATQEPTDAQVCIDQYEFPGTPCSYPVVWVRASEAAGICSAMGKRLCDAHEWEGACAGSLQPPDYDFELAKGRSPNGAHTAMRTAHNQRHEGSKRWATGATAPEAGVCAQASFKSKECDGSDPKKCGSNTYPTGAFPGCVSPLGVYDLHGNAAEHMNLPLAPEQMTSAGGTGVTEMKGSWFIFDAYRAHEDWCRWRAPYWHGGPVAASDSHRNYHLGFRCCADVETE